MMLRSERPARGATQASPDTTSGDALSFTVMVGDVYQTGVSDNAEQHDRSGERHSFPCT